ncbi:MAG TPA: DUF1905 domain-containing protein, partial [Bacteroidia bacterium]|nr:DUF1905 domain-containing protein [Bacteroidia bacterium]
MVSRIHKFSAELLIIGVNPFVFVPEKILRSIFKDAGKEKGFIRVKGKVNAHPYKQTLVKFRGEWRLYINTTMLKNSPKRIGEKIKVEIAFDPEDRSIKAHPQFENALKKNPQAK